MKRTAATTRSNVREHVDTLDLCRDSTARCIANDLVRDGLDEWSRAYWTREYTRLTTDIRDTRALLGDLADLAVSS
jgi:hypothetical protein